MSRDFSFFCSPWSAHCCHGKYVAWLLIRGSVTTMVGSRFDSDYRKSHPTPGDSVCLLKCVVQNRISVKWRPETVLREK